MDLGNRRVCPGGWRIALAVLAAAGTVSGPARAQGVQGDAAAQCAAISAPLERLACYDRLHGRPVESPARPDAAAPAPAADPVAARAAASAPAATAAASATPRLARRWDLAGDAGAGLFVPRPYRPVYVLPATWTDRANTRPTSPAPDHTVTSDLNLRPVEAKYQLSLKAKLARSLFGTPLSLWGGYTQSSRWQVYNGADSRPFRETNYEPELLVVAPLQGEVLGWRLGLASLSLSHQSNGRALPLSRSWNRIIGTLAFERGDWVAELRPWWRIPESQADDDNPDISNHLGRMELQLNRYWGDHAFVLQLRHSLRSGAASRGSAQLEWVFPIEGALHGYLQVFTGYGESLVDYNLRQNRIGLGLTIAGWQ
ncbi:MAG TPA: phospholipase A [Burkholderiaceae bacterium]|nr:phospholipase A [Burkholderiaceae bacterium]